MTLNLQVLRFDDLDTIPVSSSTTKSQSAYQAHIAEVLYFQLLRSTGDESHLRMNTDNVCQDP